MSLDKHCGNQSRERIGFYQIVNISFLTILQLCRNLILTDFMKVSARVVIMHRRIVIGLLIVLSLTISLSSIWGGTIIAEATLHISPRIRFLRSSQRMSSASMQSKQMCT